MITAESTPITDDLINQLKDKIVYEYQPEKIILFGSAAKKNNKPNDIDLFIIKETDQSFKERYITVNSLFSDRLFSLDIFVYTPQEVTQAIEQGNYVVEDIIKTGRTIYDQTTQPSSKMV